MYLFVLSWLFVGCSYGLTNDELWEQWKSKFGKQYGLDDGLTRREIWEKTVRKIAQHNIKHDLGLVTYTLGLNQFSDMDWEEFKSTYLMQNFTNQLAEFKASVNAQALTNNYTNSDIPNRVDWRDLGLVTEVENQGNCHSCWSFASTGVVEGQYKKKTGNLVSFSKQEMIDCGKSYGIDGCNEAILQNAMQYIVDNGLAGANEYSYLGKPSICRMNEIKPLAIGKNYFYTDKGDDKQLTHLLAEIGPVSVTVRMGDDFHHYKSGIYNLKSCHKDSFHAMLAVGYGPDYYIIKNSWGTSWGEHGFVRFARNPPNLCEVAQHIIYILLK